MDRRNFLSEFFGFGKDAVKTSLGLKETEELLSDIGKWERESYWSTTGENAIVIIGKIVVMLYVKKATDVKVGNASSEKIEENLKEDPITAGLMANVIAPVTEEVIFRLLPDRVLEYTNEGHLKGVAIQALFAWVHGTKTPSGERIVPVPQFLGGCFYWYLIRRKDVSHSILAHAQNNMVATSSIMLEKL